MQIGALLQQRKFTTTKKKTDRQLLLEEIQVTLNLPKTSLRGLHFQCANLTDPEIRDCFDQAKKWQTNPAALFRKLIKDKVEITKKHLKYNVLPTCTCDWCNYFREKIDNE